MRVVIVGAAYAGLACALELARKAPSNTEVTLINTSDQFVERIRLHEQAAGRAAPAFDLSAFLRGTRVRLEVGRVERVDLAARRVHLESTSLGWDRLVLALGSRTARDAVPGVREHACTLDADDAARLAEAMPELVRRGGHVVVVGGGLTGIEAATELAESHPSLRVSLLTCGAFASELAPKSRTHLTAVMRRLGVRIHEHTRARRLERGLLHTDGSAIPFDACVWSAGFEAPPLARAAGLALTTSGQVVSDAMLRAEGRDDVYVAGDLLALRAQRGDPLTQGCKSAFPTGLHVAANLIREARGEPPHPYVHRAVFFCVSLGRRDALLQFPSADLRAARRVWTGKRAARVKALIVDGTRWMLVAQRTLARLAERLRPAPRALPEASAVVEPR
ncbi:MAG: FAD-dependent oxidoreductase [Polyangiales bacterium]